MNLLNRYLQAVGRLLPKARREDIIAELRANILSQMEDREEALARPLTDDEQAAILQHHGNPTVIAGRYSERNLGLAFGVQLIGPELFPIYKRVLLLNLTIMGILAIVSPFIVPAGTFESFLSPFVIQISVITLIFVILDRNKRTVLDKWDPRKLPTLQDPPEDGPNARSVFNFVTLAVGIVWLAVLPESPHLFLWASDLGNLSLPVKPMPQWIAFNWAIVTVASAQLVLQFFRLFRWLPTRKARMVDLALKSVGLIIGVLLLFKFPTYVSSESADLARWANLTVLICVIVAVAITLFGIGKLVFSLLRERHQMLPARQY